MPDHMVIVLDPGHGGENEGLTHNGLIEKDMNLVTANAMRDELLQFDNIEVYITNPDKTDMSLKERAEYAKSVEADIVISLHFNMSESHQMYGSEVWIPSTGLGYSKMHSLGDIFLDQFDELGMTIRGVKTRLNDDGLDYYGIIRESAALSMPCILVEHGYADHARDFDKVDSAEDWAALGRMDARAVAKYYGLRSASLGTDYSDFVKNGYFAPEQAVPSDTTEPVNAVIVWTGESQGRQQYTISASEPEGRLVYYAYSTDGGETWSEVLPFEGENGQMTIELAQVQPGSEVCARIYNGYFLFAQTNTIVYVPRAAGEEQTQAQETAQGSQQEVTESTFVTESAAGAKNSQAGLVWSGFGLFLALMLILVSFLTYRERQRLRRHRTERPMDLGKMRQVENICLLGGLVILLASGVCGIRQLQKVDIIPDAALAQTAVMDEETEDEAESAAEGDAAVNGADSTPPTVDAEESSEGAVLKTDMALNASMRERAEENVTVPVQRTTVYDIAEGFLSVPLLETVARNPYQLSAFSGTDLQMQYQAEDGWKTMLGVDVSKFQGDIDWAAVKEAGVQFAIFRLGIRGYGTGALKMDEKFYVNLQGAQAQGLKTGVYFFSAAINEQEAVEEAEFVLQALSGYSIDMPVVFDTEPIYYDVARTDVLTPNQLTAITRAFCDTVKKAGYTPMIYANSKRYTTVLHLEQLTDYEMWLADYRSAPDYPYAFQMWQFTESGSVPGIDGNVDIDLYFYKE